MNSRLSLLLLLLLSAPGCQSVKEKVGDYVTEAVHQKAVKQLEKELHKRDLSLTELKVVADSNRDGRVDKAEVLEAAKATAKDYVAVRMEAYEEKKKADAAEATRRLKDHFTAEGRARRKEEAAALEREAKLRDREVSRLRTEADRAREELRSKIKDGRVKPVDLTKYDQALLAHEQALKNQEQGVKAQSGLLSDFWNWLKATVLALIATVLGYLTKQVFSAKADGRRDARIAILEKATGIDLNQDGIIGNGGGAIPSASPESTT